MSVQEGLGIDQVVEDLLDELSGDNPRGVLWGIIEALGDGIYDDMEALLDDLRALEGMMASRDMEMLEFMQTELMNPYGPIEQAVSDIMENTTWMQEQADELAYEHAVWMLSEHYEKIGPYCGHCGNYTTMEEDLRRKMVDLQSANAELTQVVRQQELMIAELEIIARGASNERSS